MRKKRESIIKIIAAVFAASLFCVIAEAINYLNSDPDGRKPAVIGIDTLYVGESGNPAADTASA